MSDSTTLIFLFINLIASISLNFVYKRRLDNYALKTQLIAMSSPNLPQNLLDFLNEVKIKVSLHFSQKHKKKKGPGRPRQNRLPFFLTALWYQLFHRGNLKDAVNELNQDPVLAKFLGIPETELKLTTFTRFIKEELSGYLKAFIPENVHELITKGIVPGKILAVDDYPIESFLNMSKAIDFPLPKQNDIESFFSKLVSLDWIDELLKHPPNKQRGWQEYVKIYLFHLIWGFVSNKQINEYIKAHPEIRVWLRLKKNLYQ